MDADVLIWHLRFHSKAVDLLNRLQVDSSIELWVGAMQRAEVIFFIRKEEEEKTRLFLAQFKTAPVDQQIIDQAGALYRQWHPSHGVGVNDAILAATAMLTGGKIYCLNTKHYPMPDVAVTKAW